MTENANNINNNSNDILNLIKTKELRNIFQALGYLLNIIKSNSSSKCDNLNMNHAQILKSIGEAFHDWVDKQLTLNDTNDTTMFASVCADLDAYVDMYQGVASSNDKFIIGLVRLIHYCISKLYISNDDNNTIENDTDNEAFPKCDDAILVFSSTVLSRSTVKSVVKILKSNNLYQSFIRNLSKIVKHGETFSSQEYSLEIILRICIYESSLTNHQDRDFLVSTLPLTLAKAVQENNFKGCSTVYNDKRTNLNTINEENPNITSFMVSSLFVITPSSSIVQNQQTPCDFEMRSWDSLQMRRLAENIWLDIERRTFRIYNIDFHVSDIVGISFGQVNKRMLISIEFVPGTDMGSFNKKEIITNSNADKVQLAISFSPNADMNMVITTVGDRVAKYERDSTLKRVMESHQMALGAAPSQEVEQKVSSVEVFQRDDISECTDGSFEEHKPHITPLTQDVDKKLATKSVIRREYLAIETVQGSRIEFGLKAIDAKRKVNVVSSSKAKQKSSELPIIMTMARRSSKVKEV